MTGRYGKQDHNHEVSALLRDAMAQVCPEALLVGEHVHDYSLDVPGDGWHGVMNDAGFTRPVWTWRADPADAPDFLGSTRIAPRLVEVAADLRWVYAADDVLVYLRESADEVALVHVARAAHDPLHIDVRHLPGIAAGRTAYGSEVEVEGDLLTLEADAPTVHVLVWEPAAQKRIRAGHGGRRPAWESS